MKKIVTLLCICCMFIQAYAWKPQFAGHRGSYRGVENTEEAMMNGINHYGYTGLEIDVKTTSDGEYVCWHDDDLSRVGHNVQIPYTKFTDLKDLTLTQTRGGVTYTAKILTVDRYLEICKENNVFPIIELKWAVGINSNDMSRFPGLYKLIEKHGLVEEARILTSMQKSLEYVRTNYPALKCQYLCYEVSQSYYEWCKKWGINPSVQTGGLTKAMARKCHEAGMEVACWTVNSEASYLQHGELGCTTMTCDYLVPGDMPELEEVDWEALSPTPPLDNLYVTPLFNYSETAGNLPENFPTTLSGSYTQAQQAAFLDGVFYMADFNAKKVVAVDTTGKVWEPGLEYANLRHGICRDDAGNLILLTSPDAKVPSQLTVFKVEDNSEHVIEITLNNNAQTHFPTASGDIFSAAGGYVYFFPNNQSFVEVVKIANGQFVSTTSCAVSLKGTAGYVIPIDNNPNHFIYQIRGNGYHLYKNGDKGSYLTSPNGTTAPARNNTYGGALFQLNGHDMFVYTSGSHYKGGWTVRDMTSADLTPMYTQAELGTGGYNANASTGAFFWWERLDDVTVNLYEYCLGHGIAGWELSAEPHKIRVKGLSLSESNITLNVGDTAHITAIITPANADDQNITWRRTPSDRVSKLKTDGLTATLTSSKAGTYTVTATLGEFQAECTVTFTEETTDVEDITTTDEGTHKIIHNGQVQIVHEGKHYSITGEKL
ncbi:MAG: glycerophosphodiester phosphodiesterase family protein [Paludibacteraceae bacterium]|nr:glycerophosphodiester phosphodiesterase family protein [Paludibacteraceae bacterium]